MDFNKYLVEYSNVSREELHKIRESLPSSEQLELLELLFSTKVQHLHQAREKEKKHGRAALRTRPLVQLLSVSFQPKNDQPISIYGRIHADFYDSRGVAVYEIYNRTVPEILTATNTLTLNGPHSSCWPQHACLPLHASRMNFCLFDGADNSVFARESFSLDDSSIEDGYEHVKSKLIQCERGSLIVNYIAIPFGVACRVQVMLNNRNFSKRRDFINVFGKIAVSYANTYGDYSSQESILFQKQDDDFERVEIDHDNSVLLSRCWVALPAYSSLVVGVDLSEFETKQNIVKDTTHFLPEQSWGDTRSFVLDDFFVRVHVSWLLPEPPRRNYQVPLQWSLRPHKSKPWPSSAVEIFSIFIGREKSKAVHVFGSIEVLSDECEICYIFKRDENDALGLSEHMKSAPVLDGSRIFEYCSSLQMKFDIKDVEGDLAIKGYVDWNASVLDSSSFFEKQLCSFIQGEHGFAAVHYSIFSEAVGANIKVFLSLKRGYADVYPEVCGSVIAHYNCYDYSSQYNKDYYQMVLFRRTRDDSIQPSADWAIPLSRSMVVVPSYSSLMFNVNLSIGVFGQKCVKEIEVEIGTSRKIIETDDFSLRIELDWCEIK